MHTSFGRNMYYWRNLSPDGRAEALALRKAQHRPWHSPPHGEGSGRFMLTAACFEHAHIIGSNGSRVARFEEELLTTLDTNSFDVSTWVVLPNHYHALGICQNIEAVVKALGRLHGRTAYCWNGEDGMRGRQVWCKAVDSRIKSDDHFHGCVNYIHHNPVKHGWAKTWMDWPFSGAEPYLRGVGREEAIRRWNRYDISRMGDGWDP